MATKFNTIQEFVKNVSRGTFGITVTTVTEPKMKKTNNPYYGRVKKLTILTNVALGYDYENTANNRLERNGLTPCFKAQKSNGKTWEEYPYILKSDKDASVKYLRCTMRQNTKVENHYILDGIFIKNEKTISEIKSFIQASGTSKKQAECGLDDENQVIVRDFKLENIIALKQGEKYFQ